MTKIFKGDFMLFFIPAFLIPTLVNSFVLGSNNYSLCQEIMKQAGQQIEYVKNGNDLSSKNCLRKVILEKCTNLKTQNECNSFIGILVNSISKKFEIYTTGIVEQCSINYNNGVAPFSKNYIDKCRICSMLMVTAEREYIKGSSKVTLLRELEIECMYIKTILNDRDSFDYCITLVKKSIDTIIVDFQKSLSPNQICLQLGSCN